MLPVNKAGMGLQNPVTSSEEKYTISLCASYNLIGTVTGDRNFSSTYLIQLFNEVGWYGKKYWYDVNDAKLRLIVSVKVPPRNSPSSAPILWVPG